MWTLISGQKSLDNDIIINLDVWKIHLSVWTNTFYSLNKYILQFEQIHFIIWIAGAGQIRRLRCSVFAIWTNTFSNLDKYTLKFKQIHLATWTNTFSNLDKYTLQFGQIHLAIWMVGVGQIGCTYWHTGPVHGQSLTGTTLAALARKNCT